MTNTTNTADGKAPAGIVSRPSWISYPNHDVWSNDEKLYLIDRNGENLTSKNLVLYRNEQTGYYLKNFDPEIIDEFFGVVELEAEITKPMFKFL